MRPALGTARCGGSKSWLNSAVLNARVDHVLGSTIPLPQAVGKEKRNIVPGFRARGRRREEFELDPILHVPL